MIDFGDDDREGDINDSALDALLPAVSRLRNELEKHLRDGKKGEIVRDGIQVVLCGPPNAGTCPSSRASSLSALNAFAATACAAVLYRQANHL